MALSGVMIRMPLVCGSIVASAFQYGWAPTLMPATMMLTSPPSWVKVMIRRNALATPSMFSVPLSIEIFAPEDRVNHSTGTPSSSARSMAATTIAHSATATVPSALVGSPNSATRVMPSGYFAVGVVTRPATTPAVFCPGGRSTGPKSPSASKSYSVKRAVRAGQQRHDLVRVRRAAGTRALHLLGVLVQRRQRVRSAGRSP